MRTSGFGFPITQDNGIPQAQLQPVTSAKQFLREVRKYVANPELFAKDTSKILTWDRVSQVTPFLFDAGCMSVMKKVLTEGKRWSYWAIAHQAMEHAIRKTKPEYQCLSLFIDTPGRSKEDIVAMIDVAINQLD